MKKITEVAAAVIVQADGQFLLGRRPQGGFYAGYWEFPGGKVEAGETPYVALVRELEEELGIRVTQAYPWIVREFVYEHAHVRLHFFRVVQWQGALRDLQHDALAWQKPGAVSVAPLLPANAPVLAALSLSQFYAITNASGIGGIGVDAQLSVLALALENGLRMVQIRESKLPVTARVTFAQDVISLCRQHDAKVFINADVELARQCGADGVHLPAAQLMQTTVRPDFPLLAASCHTALELAQAVDLALDFVVLGPVQATHTHPEQTGMGWQNFAQLIQGCPLPVYALGGLGPADLSRAWQAGAHGVAAIRAAWT